MMLVRRHKLPCNWIQASALYTNFSTQWRKKYDRRPPQNSLKETKKGELIPQIRGEALYGVHSVLQALECAHRTSHCVYLRDVDQNISSQSSKIKLRDHKALERIKELASDQNLAIRFLSKWMLNHITSDKPHQGVVLDTNPLKLTEFRVQSPVELQKNSKSNTIPTILALDELHDPQNLGAILRSAHFLGCIGVIVSDKNTAPLSATVSKASAGALEILVANNKLQKTRNLHETLAMCREEGWRIVGASSGSNSTTSIKLLGGIPTILVLGNEHKGIRKNILNCCDELVLIPEGNCEKKSRVDSLNVSVAAGILLYELIYHK